MDALAIGTSRPQNPFAPVGGGAGVSTGVRQALALIHGVAETGEAVRIEAQFIPRRIPPPFQDKVDIRSAERAKAEPAPEPEPDVEIRKLSPTGLPAIEKAKLTPRGRLLDIET
jgi:hypothetical protein